MAGIQPTALAVMALITASCKGPAPPSPADLARSAAKARAAAAKSTAPPAPPAPPAPARPVLVLQEFSDQVPPGLCAPVRGGSCALDVVASVVAQTVTVVKRDQETMLVGWSAEVETGTVPPVVLVQLSHPEDAKVEDKKAPASKAKAGKVFSAAATRITKRTDVAETLKIPAFVDSGYDLLASFKNVPASEYTVSIVQVTAAGKALICDTRRRLKIE